MSATLLDGRGLARQVKAEIKAEIAELSAQWGALTLAVVQIGDDESAAGYARAIEKNCKSVGAGFTPVVLAGDTPQEAAASEVDRLNRDAAVHGIMILEPVPSSIDLDQLIQVLDPAKDVDGVHPINAGRLMANRPPFMTPATPAGGMRLLDDSGMDLQGKHAVMVGRSDIVGKPMAMLLLHRHCTVTLAHSRTQDLPALCREADILCIAVGRPEMVQGDWVKPGAVVVDFGTNYTDDGLKGDCDQAAVREVAGLLTPVPGGTGPMTNAMLMGNLLYAARQSVAG